MERLQSSQRIAGLDLLRALAIVLVLVAHYPKTGVGLVTRVLNFGWSGVDLFFVLSGYLIAGQLFAAQASGKPISLAGFYSRRWLRTLPNYYVVLAVYGFVAALIGGATPTPVWKYLSFTQNVGIPGAFTPSWSLCVEEQFYLLFPIIAILLARTNKPALTVSVFGGVLALEVALRAGIWLATRPDRLAEPYALATFMGTLYYPTWCRLDGIVPCSAAVGCSPVAASPERARSPCSPFRSISLTRWPSKHPLRSQRATVCPYSPRQE